MNNGIDSKIVNDQCSGIALVDGKRVCRHGFPLTPGCEYEPMRTDKRYHIAPCMDEKFSAWLFPETGQPPEHLWR